MGIIGFLGDFLSLFKLCRYKLLQLQPKFKPKFKTKASKVGCKIGTYLNSYTAIKKFKLFFT